MRLISKRFHACILAFTLLLLSGCTPGESTPASPAMGRYVESKLTLPCNFFEVLCTRSTDGGSVDILGFMGESNRHVFLKWFQSSDGGISWSEQPASPGLEEINSKESSLQISAAAWAPDDTLWFYGYDYSGNLSPTDFFARINEDGVLERLPWTVPESSEGIGVRQFLIAENGDLVVNYHSEFMQLDSGTGTVKYVYTVKNGGGGEIWNDGSAIHENTLALSEYDHINFYDLNTGERTGAVACISSQSDPTMTTDTYRVMSYSTDGILYFADPTGIYRSVKESDVLERVADGGLNSLSAPSLTRISLTELNGQFLLLGFSQAERYNLLSYTYDPDVPTLPGTTLSVYALEEDPLIRQAISQFQYLHPSTYVSFEIGVPADSSITRDDALRTLATQLTAGKGPDILVLDGMPIDSYMEKGVLSNLSDLMNELRLSGEALPNVISAYEQDSGDCYVLPAQFRVPLLHGSDEAMDAAATLTGMADWLEANRESFQFPLSFSYYRSYLRFFYPLFADSLQTGEGGMDAEKLASFLSELNRIYSLDQPHLSDDEAQYDDTDFQFGALRWMYGSSGLDVGELAFFGGLYCAWTTSRDLENGSIEPLFQMNAFRPITLLGVSAQSQQGELAQDFIRCVLSGDVQSAAVGNGIPVSAAAFDASTQMPAEAAARDGVYSTYGTSFLDEDGAIVPFNIQVFYPPLEWRKAFADRIQALDTPLLYDETVLQLLIDGTKDYFAGRSELNTTVSTLMEKLNLYRAE